jgi:Subtilase family
VTVPLLLLLLPTLSAAPLDVDAWGLVRVDVPDLPGAEASSELGSTLLVPPTDPSLRWRVESVPELDVSTGPMVADEALDALGARAWLDQGIDGSGVRVAIFDLQWYAADTYADELGDAQTHDCQAHRSCDPAMDTLRPRYSFEVGAHGIACAQLIHDIAPGAELHLVRVNGQTTLENAVAWAVREGIDLISMSLSFSNNSFYDGTGPVNDQMDVLAAGGVLMVTSAGNYATEHWNQDFRDTDGDGLNEFFVPDEEGGTVGGWRETLPIWMYAGAPRVSLIWDEFSACGQTDLDAYIYDSEGSLIGRATDTQIDTGEGESCEPVERVRAAVATTGWHYLVVERVAGTGAPRFDVMARDQDVWRYHAGGSVTDPGTHPAVLTVGAVRADGYATNGAESFSSRGPTSSGLAKPDIAGPDGVSTTVYGQSGFYGTSASTPAVVGALALLMSSEPGMSSAEAVARLQQSALRDVDTMSAGGEADMALGAGRARLPTLETTPPAGCGSGGAAMVLPVPLLWLLRGQPRRRQRDRQIASSEESRTPPR